MTISCFGTAYSIVWLDERVVNGDNIHALMLDTVSTVSREAKREQKSLLRIAEDDAANTAEAINTDLQKAAVRSKYVAWCGWGENVTLTTMVP
jgi:hypothetical protein